MGWLSRVLGTERRPPAGYLAADARGVASRSAVGRYDAELVPGLRSDHEELLTMVTRIADTVDTRRYNEIPRRLGEFKTRLEAHLLAENYRFYAYLEDHFSYDAENAALMRDFRREMSSIARQVVHFIQTWRQSGVTDATADRFRDDFNRVATLLKQRIDREEQSLYPMYAPMN